MRYEVICAFLLTAATAVAQPDAPKPAPPATAKEMNAFLATLPPVELPGFTQERAMALVAMPLACIDHLQALPEQRTEYLWMHDGRPRVVDNFAATRAFYGCSDWHSAVNSTWTMIAVLKEFPHIPVGPLIKEKLKEHLGKKNIEGEIEFFKTARTFELPYGYAWLLKVYGELVTWNDPDANAWAQNLAPLVEVFSKKVAEYLTDLPLPVRGGMHPNTTFVSTLMLDYTNVVNDVVLRDVIQKTAKKYFLKDRGCATSFEPQGSDFLSPCLAEAQLMSRVLDQAQFVTWLNDFLPPLDSESFKPLTSAVNVKNVTKKELEGGKSHLIGLGFSRGHALTDIANALPADDPRIPVLRRLAGLNVSGAYGALADAGYAGSHWFATYAILYAKSAQKAK